MATSKILRTSWMTARVGCVRWPLLPGSAWANRSTWKAFLRTPFGIGVTAFVVGAVLGVVGMLYFQNSQTIAKPQAPDVSVVYERIISQNELVTASERYNITDKATDANEFFNLFEIPFTENSFWYRYVGTIKVGVNLDDATFSQEGDTITVSLPSPYISSDTPDMSFVKV